MINRKVRGFAYGSIAAISYGLNPLFTLPLYQTGMTVDSVLFYRYFFAIVMLGVLMKIRGIPFGLKKAEIVPLTVMGLMFSFSSFFLFLSYNYMDAGIASTILFVYPILVAIIMALFFHEKVSFLTQASIALAFIGILLLYKGGEGKPLSLLGVLFVFMSSLTYAIYIIGVNHSFLRTFPAPKLTFYVLLFGISIYVVRLNFGLNLQPVPSPLLWVNALSLALFPTIISLITMTLSIHYIGSTPAAILGALEPLTALFFGVLVFGEQLTFRIVIGILFILTGVTLIVASESLKKQMLHKWHNRVKLWK
ncbi:MAG: DMT family transporter [Bacteroides sp.]|jgi:drug/metabolite transporter (DMT)-like permease|nr:DMT family transporter [Bacteroides sp.]MCI1682061.1 DMT family transporter [Bacteroides sp.]